MSRVSASRPALVAGAIGLVLLGVAASRTGAQSGAPPAPSTAPDITATLAGAPWRIVEVAGKRAPADARITFSGTTIAGSAGCNRFFAPLIAGGAPRIGSIKITLMMCKDRMEDERALLTALRQVRIATRTGDMIELRDGDGVAVLKLAR